MSYFCGKRTRYNRSMKYVALLRGIGPTNPNMRNDKLRSVLEDLGFKNVQSVIATGNLIFESESKNTSVIEAKIERAWPAKLGFDSTTIVRSADDLQKLVDAKPFKGIDDLPTSRLNVTFLKNIPTYVPDLPFVSKNRGYSVTKIKGQEVFSVIDLSGATTPDTMLWLEKQFGKEITTRTWKTVHRILKKLNEV